MNFNYKLYLDKRAKRISIFTILLLTIIAGVLGYVFRNGGNYITAWFVCFVVAVLLLSFLSMPRRVRVNSENLELRCVLNVVILPKDTIKSVKRLPIRPSRYFFPVWASHGFFGYHGLYFNLASRRFVRIYASRWDNFVQIETKTGQRYVVNCDDSRRLIASIL